MRTISSLLMIFLKASLHSGDSPGLLEPADTLATPDLPAAAAVNNIQQQRTVVTAQGDGVSQSREVRLVCCRLSREISVSLSAGDGETLLVLLS